MAMGVPFRVVQVDGQEYRLDSLPSNDSKLVVAEKNKILSVAGVDVNNVARDLGIVESHVDEVYKIMKKARAKYTGSEVTIQRLKSDTRALSTKSALTIIKLKDITTTIHTDLKLAAIYGNLIVHQEGTVVETLTVVSGAAKDIEKVTDELQHEFQQAVTSVEDALKELTEVVVRQEEVQSSLDQLTEGMSDNLWKAVRYLKELSVIMIRAAHFWKQIHDYCRSLADEFLKQVIQRILSKHPEGKCLEIWTSTHFKTRIVQVYVGWVALHSICSDYIKYVILSQPDFYKGLQDSIAMREGAIETLVKCLSKLRIHHVETTGSTENCSLPNIGLAFRLLLPIASKWQNIGCLLGIPEGELESIRQKERETCDNCLRRMLSTWLKQQVNSPPTWEALANAVEVFDPTIAKELKKM